MHALRKEIKDLKAQQKNTDGGSGSGKGSSSSSDGNSGANRSSSSSGDRQRSSSRARSSSRGRSESRGRSRSVRFESSKVDKKTERKKQKEEKKRLEKEQVEQTGGEARPTRICPECFYKGTYASSQKCHKCRVPFGTQVGPTPQAPPQPSQAWASLTNKAAATALDDIHKVALVHLKGFAAAQPPPPPPPPSLTSAAPTAGTAAPQGTANSAAGSAAPAAAAQTAPSAQTIALVEADAAADEEGAKQLIALRARRAATIEQLKQDTEDADWQTALKARLDRINRELEALLAKRQAELDPHQLGQVLSKKQLQASEAAKAATDVEKAAQASLAALDKEAAELEAKYDKHVQQILAAKLKAKEASATERAALQTQLKAKIDEARELKDSTQRLLDAAQAAHDLQTGASASAAQAAQLAQAAAQQTQLDTQNAAAAQHLNQQKAAAELHLTQLAKAAEEHQKQQDLLVAQQEEAAQRHLQQQRALKAQVAEQEKQVQEQQRLLKEAQSKLAEQQQMTQPTALLPPAVLPVPDMPKSEQAAQSLYVLQSALKMLAMQETQVMFTWADLGAAKLCWGDFCKLVPVEVTAQSIPNLDPEHGPKEAEPVPRRTLECLRVQLDSIMTRWTAKDAEAAAKNELNTQANAFAATILDQAKRIQDKKRLAAPLAATEQKVAKPAAPETASAAAVPSTA